jgi:hypothetical protein
MMTPVAAEAPGVKVEVSPLIIHEDTTDNYRSSVVWRLLRLSTVLWAWDP